MNQYPDKEKIEFINLIINALRSNMNIYKIESQIQKWLYKKINSNFENIKIFEKK